MSSGGYFLGLRRSWREADHSPPSSAKVKNAWSYNSTSHVFTVWIYTSLHLPSVQEVTDELSMSQHQPWDSSALLCGSRSSTGHCISGLLHLWHWYLWLWYINICELQAYKPTRIGSTENRGVPLSESPGKVHKYTRIRYFIFDIQRTVHRDIFL
jgi:hypothetical protein